MKTLAIKNPIYVKGEVAYFALSDWNFENLSDSKGRIEIEVYQNGELMGRNIVRAAEWKRNCDHKEEVVKLHPDDPMVFYYGKMKLIPPPSKMSEREFAETILR